MASKKKAVTLGLADPIDQLLRDLVRVVNGKQKWQVFSAAVLALAELPIDVRNYYVRQIGDADGPGGDYAELIERAVSGSLRDEAFDEARKNKGPLRVEVLGDNPTRNRRGRLEAPDMSDPDPRRQRG